MFIRIFEALVLDKKGPELESVYREQIMPFLERTDGCLFAGLLQSANDTATYISLTLWESEETIRKYIDSGNFEKNLSLASPFLESSSEWKIQLSKDETIEYVPVSQEPVVKSYPVDAGQQDISDFAAAGRSYLRVLSLKVKPGHEERFKKIYYTDIHEELENIAGCRAAFLVDNSGNDNEMLSFTIWDSPESVDEYEKEGEFTRLMDKIRDTLAGLYQWKMALENKKDAPDMITSRDIDISRFTLITGKKFK